MTRSRMSRTLLLGLCATLSLSLSGTAANASGACLPTSTNLCLTSGQFSLGVDLELGGMGQVLPLSAPSWGAFTFGDPRYMDLFVEVLNGCGVNNHYWVRAIGLSDVGFTLNVLDVTGADSALYDNPSGSYLAAFDTMALASCPTPLRPAAAQTRGVFSPVLPLDGDRFRATLAWQNGENSGFGQAMPITSHSGSFELFSQFPEVFVTLFDGTAANGFFHVIWGSLSQSGLTLDVADACTGSAKTYSTQEGAQLGVVADELAFSGSTCVLYDGFESGNADAWSAVVGLP